METKCQVPICEFFLFFLLESWFCLYNFSPSHPLLLNLAYLVNVSYHLPRRVFFFFEGVE
jgi:hypothetical protein